MSLAPLEDKAYLCFNFSIIILHPPFVLSILQIDYIDATYVHKHLLFLIILHVYHFQQYVHFLIHKYNLHFEKGYNVGGLKKEPYSGKDTGTKTRWKPDIEVFTDINIPTEYFLDTLKRQAIVNDGLLFVFREQQGAKFVQQDIVYANGIKDYVSETVGDEALTPVQFWHPQNLFRHGG